MGDSHAFAVDVFRTVCDRLEARAADLQLMIETTSSFEEWLNWEAFLACKQGQYHDGKPHVRTKEPGKIMMYPITRDCLGTVREGVLQEQLPSSRVAQGTRSLEPPDDGRNPREPDRGEQIGGVSRVSPRFHVALPSAIHFPTPRGLS